MSIPHIHSWGKININFDVWDEPHKYYHHQGHKARLGMQYHLDFARLSYRTLQKRWTLQNWDLRVTDCIHLKVSDKIWHFLPATYTHVQYPFQNKRLHTSSFWEISDVRKNIFSHSLVFLWTFCHHTHITHTSPWRGQRQPVPFPFPQDSSSRCMPKAEDNPWKIVRYLWRSITCQDAFHSNKKK